MLKKAWNWYWYADAKWYEFWKPSHGPAGGIILGIVLFGPLVLLVRLFGGI